MTGTQSLDVRWIEPLRLGLQGMTDRMQNALMTGAHSTVAREGGDCAAAVFLPDGRLLSQARSLPLLLGSLMPAVTHVIKRFPVETMRPGDGYLLNDPWSGGSHLPDMVVIRPLFCDGVICALAASNLHHQDVGGMSPGSLPSAAHEIFQEGLRLPPIKAWRDDVLADGVRAILLANSRSPDLLAGDLASQWACVCLAEREIRHFVSRYGQGAFFRMCDHLILEAERMTRYVLGNLPDGEAVWSDRLDGDGRSEDPVHLVVTLRKCGENLEIDFTGTQDQVQGPINASKASMLAAALFFMRTLAPEAPNNAGCLAPLRFILPQGSIVNPHYPAAVNARTATVKLATNAILCAWSRYCASLPGDINHHDQSAANAGVAVVVSVGGEREDGTRYFFTEIIASGAGACADCDGVGGISTDVSNARNTPIESLEARAPLLFETYGLHQGSGGAGHYRGGDGVHRSWRLLEGHADVSYRGDRHRSQARGMSGGEDGGCTQACVIHEDGTREWLSARATVRINTGDVFSVQTAGGGGWGEAK
ncbi:hydantoinase B/oxoprolinase family protein [Acetobacter tropicalis]|uniref:5-oxoprolinase n=1 Tax=Acetobacter tropicalis TaxID=104102 RepID=A0A252A758_9PROT|nr:hydantoinase B/oxoprolinase family protein [Acetobacter tropicalis]OUI85408.1 5-oxoprolinase [Acetobacter tropicalis]